jgi:hypothetical protein
MNCGKYPATFRKQLENKVFKYEHNSPIIYWMSIDGFVDNTKDRWRSDEMCLNRELLLDSIWNMKRLDSYINRRYERDGYLDYKYYFKNQTPYQTHHL